jgi:4-hydroxybenzoate polyprenyltransferase
LFSFTVVYPFFIILLWTFFDNPSIKSIAVALTVLLFVLFGIFIKDLRDISGDEMAGLKTLGVIFTPEKLLKFAVTSIVFYYVSIAVFTLLGIYNFYTTVALIPLIPTVYSISNLSRENWNISNDTVTHLKRIMLSNMISLGLLILTGFLSQP